MTKANMTKIVEGISICNENIGGIAKDLMSIAQKVEKLSAAVEGFISLFQDKPAPAVEKKAEPKALPEKKEPEAKAEEPVKEYTFTEVRTFLADKSRAGHTAEVKKILAAHGADKLSDLDKAAYAAVMAEAEVLE